MRALRVFGTTLLVASTLTAFGSARADTYLSACALNGVLVTAEVMVTYDGALPDPLDSKTVPAFDAVVLPGTTADAVVPPFFFPPDTGDPKPDGVTAEASSRFEFGTPSGTTPLDTFVFDAAGNASALAAFNTAGNPADAVIQVIASAEFFVDPVPPGCAPARSCSPRSAVCSRSRRRSR